MNKAREEIPHSKALSGGQHKGEGTARKNSIKTVLEGEKGSTEGGKSERRTGSPRVPQAIPQEYRWFSRYK